MHRPYSDDFPTTFALATQCTALALTAVLASRPLSRRPATLLLVAGIGLAALVPPTLSLGELFQLGAIPSHSLILQASASLATLGIVLHRRSWFGALALFGQWLLFELGAHVRDSAYELTQVHLTWYGALIGIHLLLEAPPHQGSVALGPRARLGQNAAIFLTTVAVTLVVTHLVFLRQTFNGDEIATTFQAEVFAHFRAYAPIPPCRSMFENYWVFHHQGRAFSQYTPGWPLFVAPFQRLGLVWLAGPVMSGITAVGIACLSRRLASGLGTTPESSHRIVAIAGPLGAALAMLGPSMLLNGASRFSHTMVCGCFAWSIEAACRVAGGPTTGRTAFWHGVLLGSATALGVATRPGDGAMLGVGVFSYFCVALARHRIAWRAVLGTAAGFAFFGGLTLLILRLQLGEWFKTGYSIAASIHPEAEVRLSWPERHEYKYGIPLAWGAHMWWPAAPALGVAGLVRALFSAERRVVFMLGVSTLAFLGFYLHVEFSRVSDDGLGPRYVLPLVVVMSAGGAALLAPLIAAAIRVRSPFSTSRVRAVLPAASLVIAIVYGVARVAPHVYPLAHADYRDATAVLRAANRMALENAIVILEPGRLPAHPTNLAQNPPMEPNPDVLFLIRRTAEDEKCARRHFPGRKWYRPGTGTSLLPYEP
jgi:hypothetical protein